MLNIYTIYVCVDENETTFRHSYTTSWCRSLASISNDYVGTKPKDTQTATCTGSIWTVVSYKPDVSNQFVILSGFFLNIFKSENDVRECKTIYYQGRNTFGINIRFKVFQSLYLFFWPLSWNEIRKEECFIIYLKCPNY